jgi:hypothetical protein
VWLLGLYGWPTVGEGGRCGGMAGTRDATTEAARSLGAYCVGSKGSVATGRVSKRLGADIEVCCGVSGPGGVNTGAVGVRDCRCEAVGTGGTCSGARACAAVTEGKAGGATAGRRPDGGGVIPGALGAAGARGVCPVGPSDAGGVPEAGGPVDPLGAALADGATAGRLMSTGGARDETADTIGVCGASPKGSDSVGGIPEVGGPVDPLGSALADGAPAGRLMSTGGARDEAADTSGACGASPKGPDPSGGVSEPGGSASLLGDRLAGGGPAVRGMGTGGSRNEALGAGGTSGAGPEGVGIAPEGAGLGTPLDDGLTGVGVPRGGTATSAARLARAGPPSQGPGSGCGGEAGVVDGVARCRAWVAAVLVGAASSSGPYATLRAAWAARLAAA